MFNKHSPYTYAISRLSGGQVEIIGGWSQLNIFFLDKLQTLTPTNGQIPWHPCFLPYVRHS